MPKNIVTFACLALLFVALTGCRTPELPPGFDRVGGVLQNKTSRAASPEAVYALMEWYVQENREREIPQLWADYVAQQRTGAVNSMNEQWRKGLITRSAALFVTDPEDFIRIDPTALTSRTNWDSIKNQIHNLKVLLKANRAYAIPVQEATDDTFWNKATTNEKEKFVQWAHQRTMTPPEPTGLDRKKLLQQLDEIQDAVILKMHIVTAINKANELTAEHKYFEALNLLDQTRKNYAPTPDALKALQDNHTIPMLVETLELIPFSCIGHQCKVMGDKLTQAEKLTQTPFDPVRNSVRAFNDMLAETETTLTAEMQHWRADQRCHDALKKFKGDINGLATRAAKLRVTCWQHMLTQDLENINYRNATDQLLNFINLMDIPLHKQFNLYAMETVTPQSDISLAQQIKQQLIHHVTAQLPQALDIIADAADMALNVNRKPGFALALGFLARQMVNAANAQKDPQVSRRLKKLNDNYLKAEKRIEETILKRVVAISDMSSAVPGLGLTYTQDVIHALDRLLKAFKIDNLVTIAKTTVPLTRYSYTLFDGVVADFDGKEAIERQNVRIVRRFGEIKKAPNPEAQEDSTKPPLVYTQEVYEQLINVREIERLAHVRAFINMRGPGFTTLVEVNEFYSKRFIIEESHPFNDLRVIDVLKTYDLAKHPVQDAVPALTYDRIWTPGEMLDWARKDSLRVFTLKLIFHINQFPFLLANQARHFEQDDNLQETTEFWAYCFALTEQINPDAATYANVLNETSKPAAKCYEQCIADLRQQRNDIVELKKNAHDMMTRKASNLLQSLRKP